MITVRVGAPGSRVAEIANNRPLAFISGPCQIESRAHALETAHALREMA